MKRLLNSRFVDRALAGAALVVTDRRWAAPLSAAALGFGIFAGVAIGPGTAGSLATGVQQVIQLPGSGGGQGQSADGGTGAAAGGSAPLETSEAGGLEEALPSSLPLAPEAVEPLPEPAPAPAAKPAPAGEGGDEAEAEEEETQELKGVVVHANVAAGSYAMAIEGGELVSVHARELPQPGTRLTAPLRRLANGTFAAAGEIEEKGKPAIRVSFRGAVTYANPDPLVPAYTVSGRGSSLLVRVEPDPAGAAPALPAIGAYVMVTARLEPPQDAAVQSQGATTLVQSEVETESGPPSTYLDLAGIFREVAPDSGLLLLSADDNGESGADLALVVPAQIDATKLEPGDSYLATATVEADGTLTLAGIAGDEHRKGADDAGSAQGDLAR